MHENLAKKNCARAVLADSFIFHKDGSRIYRIQREGSGTIICLSREQTKRYLDEFRAQGLPVKYRGW